MPASVDTQHTRSFPAERLSGDPVLDARGREIDPGDACPVDPARLVPTMLARRELDYLHHLATTLTDRGRVVELGCFLGGSTAAIHAGLADTARINRPVLVYDGFRGPPESAFESEPQLAHFGIEPGVSFRGHFERLHRAYLDGLVIREGMLPESCGHEEAAGVYPEQEPIELLFVDVAKSWGVHVSVVRAFMRHLVPGSVVVHQDFGDFRTPWLVVHMWQMRDCLEPLDRVRQTPTVSFRCLADPGASVGVIDPRADAHDPESRESMWDEIEGYWAGVLGEDASGWLAGHRAVHALHAGDPGRVVEHAERYEDWVRSGSSAGVYTSPDWTGYCGRVPSYLRAMGADTRDMERAGMLARASGIREAMGSPTALFQSWTTESMKRMAWTRVVERLLAEKRTEIVLYGAGRHTRWLLGSGLLPTEITVRCVLDDNPVAGTLEGVEVCTPVVLGRTASPGCLVLPSSDAYEDSLVDRAMQTLGEGVEIWRVYTDPVHAAKTHDQAAEYLGLIEPATEDPVFIPASPGEIAVSSPHRVDLGLKAPRDWVGVLGEKYARPAWTRGHISTGDAAFLFDCVEASGAGRIIEIGTASGMSTLAFALAADHFGLGDGSAVVHSFDLTARCYFDPSHRVGDALREAAPELLHIASLSTGVTARDAAGRFAPRSVGLAMIDADHRHPAAAIDLLALLPVLVDGALVILHDIDLDNIRSQAGQDAAIEDGPRRLYEAWEYEKTRESAAACSNIGVLRIPADRLKVTRMLCALIDQA